MGSDARQVLIRADGDAAIGTGHVMRSLAFAQAWRELSGEVKFVSARLSAPLKARLEAEGYEVVQINSAPGSYDDAQITCGLAKTPRTWLFADGYCFDDLYQQAVKDHGLRLLLVDDHGHASRYCADIVLNHNIYAAESLYSVREPKTRLLLGPRYALLRREFLAARETTRSIPPIAHRVLVTLGGSDPENVTAKVIEALRLIDVENLEAVVVVGGSNPRAGELQTNVTDSHIRLIHNASNMPELMSWADVAVTAAGTTSCELVFMGLPSLVIVAADNQSLVAKGLEEQGIAISLGWHNALSARDIQVALLSLMQSVEKRTAMTGLGRSIVDGNGARRVSGILKMGSIVLRDANADDCKLVWEWASDPTVRQASFTSLPIPWETHIGWFQSKLNDRHAHIYIVENDEGMPVGQVRFDLRGFEAEVGLIIDRSVRGQGYSTQALSLALRKLCLDKPVRIVHAYIKTSNATSIRTFERCGFRRVSLTRIKGSAAAHYAWDATNAEAT